MHVGAHASARMDTTVGHRFVVRQVSNNEVMKEFTVRGGEDRMVVGPPGVRASSTESHEVDDIQFFDAFMADASPKEYAVEGKIHPLVTMLYGRRSTSVGAKFKSLSSRPLDMYW